MWRTDTYWFDVAVATSFLLVGHICLGKFEDYKPIWRRLLKALIGVLLVVGIAVWAGRPWVWTFWGGVLLLVLVVHGWWLPRHGVNGWTAEPLERYYELIGVDPSAAPLRRRR